MSIIIDALAAYGALSLACTGFVIWCGIAVWRDRKRAERAFDKALRRVVNGNRS